LISARARRATVVFHPSARNTAHGSEHAIEIGREIKMKAPAFSYYMHEGPAAFSIEVAGALTAEGAKKLEQDWRSASDAIGNKELVVDLSFVTEIDPAGRELLLRWRGNGATVVASTPESHALAESVIGAPVRPSARIVFASEPYWSRFRAMLPLDEEAFAHEASKQT
jgi:hypothetical protein